MDASDAFLIGIAVGAFGLIVVLVILADMAMRLPENSDLKDK